MEDLSTLSDAELMAMYAMPGLIKQESGGRAGVKGPMTRYGQAEGLTQMLPATAQATAKRIGVPWRPELMTAKTPEAAAYQEQLGQAYLTEGMAKTGNLRDGLHYYHGGPDQRQWGPKTRGYADAILTGMGEAPQVSGDLSSMSDEELLAMYNAPASAPARQAPAPKAQARASAAPQRLPQVARAPSAQPNPTIAQDALSGFVEPFQRLGSNVMQTWRDNQAETAQMRAGTWKPPTLPEAAMNSVRDLGNTASIVGQAAFALPTAITQAVVRPTARALGRIPIDPYVYDKKLLGVGVGAPRRVTDPNEKQALTESALNTALMGATAKGASARVGAVQKPATPKPMSLEDLRTAKTQAYAQAEAGGFRFKQPEVKRVADDITAAIDADGGAELYPEATKLARRISSLAEKGDLTPTQLDRYRSQVGEKLMQPGSTETAQGRMIRNRIDDLMDNANAPEWQAARDIYKQFKKAETVTNEVDSAKLRASSTYAGGNEANAIRQELRPFIDKTSPRYIRNLSPEEAKAFRQVVDGTGGANTWRVVGKVLDARGLLGQGMQVLFGVTTHGAGNIPAAAAGALASNRSNAATVKSVNKLLDLIGSRPAVPPPRISYPGALPQLGQTSGLLPLLSPRGAVGAGVIAAPLARSSSGSSGRKTAQSGRK